MKQETPLQLIETTLLRRFKEAGYYISKFDYLILDRAKKLEESTTLKFLQEIEELNQWKAMILEYDGQIITSLTEKIKELEIEIERLKQLNK